MDYISVRQPILQNMRYEGTWYQYSPHYQSGRLTRPMGLYNPSLINQMQPIYLIPWIIIAFCFMEINVLPQDAKRKIIVSKLRFRVSQLGIYDLLSTIPMNTTQCGLSQLVELADKLERKTAIKMAALWLVYESESTRIHIYFILTRRTHQFLVN